VVLYPHDFALVSEEGSQDFRTIHDQKFTQQEQVGSVVLDNHSDDVSHKQEEGIPDRTWYSKWKS
jgi:hypothetical protein